MPQLSKCRQLLKVEFWGDGSESESMRENLIGRIRHAFNGGKLDNP